MIEEFQKRKKLMIKIQLWLYNRSHKYNGYYSSTKQTKKEDIIENTYKSFFVNRIVNNDPYDEFSFLIISDISKIVNSGNNIDYLIQFIDNNLEMAVKLLSKWENISVEEIKLQFDKEYLEWNLSKQK